MAGIYGTELTGVARPVFVDANGQLGTITAAAGGGDVGTSPGPALAQQVRDQQVTIAELRGAIADLRRAVDAQQATNAELRARQAQLEARTAPAAGRH